MANKRPDGDGTVRKRADGRWEGRIVIGHKADGTPIYKSVFAKTQKELMPKLHGLIGEYRGVEVTDCDMTLEEWAERWLTEYAEPTLRASTVRGYRSLIKSYIAPALGDRQLRAIRQKDVQRFYNALKRRRVERGGEVVPIADSTVRKAHLLLHEIMDAAVSARLISRNPTNGTKVPKANYAPKAILNAEQLDRFMDAIRAEPVWYDFFYTEITTGLRRGEICGLKWSDMDETGGRLTVRRTVKKGPGGELEVGETKTEKGMRTLLLPSSTLDVLKERHKSAVTDWIFPSPRDPEKPVAPSSAYHRLKVILKSAGLPDIRFYDLRHTFATTALEHGMDVKTLSAIIGHNSVSTTLNVYTHVTDTVRAQAAATIDRAITGSTAPTPAPEPEKPSEPFRPYKGLRRKPGTGCITQLSAHCYEGKYTPRLPNGTRYIKTVYAASREECEAKLAALIAQVKPEVERVKREMREGKVTDESVDLLSNKYYNKISWKIDFIEKQRGCQNE